MVYIKKPTVLNRRKVIKTAGALATVGIGSTGITSADKDESQTEAAEVDIVDEVVESVQKGDFDQAEALLNENNVEHYSTTASVGGQKSPSPDGEFSTQSKFDIDQSTLHIQVFKDYGDVYQVSSGIYLSGMHNDIRYPSKVDDGCGITWDIDDWSSLDADKSNLDLEAYRAKEDGGPDIEFEEYDPNHGAAASVDWGGNASIGIDTVVSVSTKVIESYQSNRTPIQFKYVHTGAISDFFSSVDIGIGPVGLTVDLDDSTEVFSEHVTAGPGEYDSR